MVFQSVILEMQVSRLVDEVAHHVLMGPLHT